MYQGIKYYLTDIVNTSDTECLLLLQESLSNFSTRNDTFLRDVLVLPDGCRIRGGIHWLTAIAVCIFWLFVLCVMCLASSLQRYRRGLRTLFRG